MTSYPPPTEAGMPTSVKHRKKAWMKAPARVPSRGRRMAIQKVARSRSPMTLETMMVFLSTKPMVLWISRKATGMV